MSAGSTFNFSELKTQIIAAIREGTHTAKRAAQRPKDDFTTDIEDLRCQISENAHVLYQILYASYWDNRERKVPELMVVVIGRNEQFNAAVLFEPDDPSDEGIEYIEFFKSTTETSPKRALKKLLAMTGSMLGNKYQSIIVDQKHSIRKPLQGGYFTREKKG